MTIETPILNFSCPACGENPATINLPDDWTHESIAHCNKCGVSFGKYGEISERIRQAQEIEGRRPAAGALAS
ncbi:hypothetical protein [Paracoccus sp. (in: a-proteobacteria)]|uniref:hypothetical protein n=1 Tax=Paracoccus sp. TaxID=267 RepID=UPI0028994A73|nr:hypothetical protein [Paracoccus sp. (in: a-proteobacteria)]